MTSGTILSLSLSLSLALSLGCRTGEAKVTGAYKLPARSVVPLQLVLYTSPFPPSPPTPPHRHVIHTVGPRYNVRYRTAAESALYNCYRSVMQIVHSRRLATVAFSTLNSSRRGYPPEDGAHIAIRKIIGLTPPLYCRVVWQQAQFAGSWSTMATVLMS